MITTKAASGTSGTWLVDPTDFNIVAGNGAYTNSGIGATTLLNLLTLNGTAIFETVAGGNDLGNININAALTLPANSNLTLTAANNINVNAAVSWNSGTLTLNAGANIYVSAAMAAHQTAKFVGTYGAGTNADGTPMGLYVTQLGNPVFRAAFNFSNLAGGAFKLNGENYTVITDSAQLAPALFDLAGNYVLGNGVGSFSQPGIGTALAPFTGRFNGLGNEIRGGREQLTATGYFGEIGSGAVISNLRVDVTVNAGATSTAAVGLLANVNRGSIINSMAIGTLNTRGANQAVTVGWAGGLVGVNSGLIAQSSSQVRVLITTGGGGLVGHNEADGRIIDSSAFATVGNQGVFNQNANVLGISYAGGLVGLNAGEISRSYATNVVNLSNSTVTSGERGFGGFVGKNTGTIDQSFSYRGTNTSSIFSSAPDLGGFVGWNTGTITNAYTTSLNTVTAAAPATATWGAGFVFKNEGTISSAFATSYWTNTAAAEAGKGFVADNTGGTLNNVYWSAASASGTPLVTDSSSATRLAAADATVFANYVGFESNIWAASKSGFPALRNIMVYAGNALAGTQYGLTGLSGVLASGVVRGLQGGGGDPARMDNISPVAAFTPYNAFTVITNSDGYVDAGIWASSRILSSSLYTNINGLITIVPKILTVSGGIADKVYDGTTAGTAAVGAPNGGLVGLVGNQTLDVTYSSIAFNNKDAGANKGVTFVATLADGANGGLASNYRIVNLNTTASITPKPIAATFTAADKVYDGSTDTEVTSWQLSGVIAGDNPTLTYGTPQFSSKNAAQNQIVTLAGLGLTGTGAGNYQVQNPQLQTLASITPRPLTLVGVRATNGTDNTFNAANLVVTNRVAGDQVSVTGVAILDGSAPGLYKVNNLSSLTIINNPNSNYTLINAQASVTIGDANRILDHIVTDPSKVTIDDKSVSNQMIITQTSDKAIINWLRFSIAANESVIFRQPSATAITLNRVTGNERSLIDGVLSAPDGGRVFILNSNGVLFSAGSSVNVGSIVASTLAMSNSDFLAGTYRFATDGGTGSVVAAGGITVADGGFAALASERGVTQSGTINAHGGKVILASANALTLTVNPAGQGLAGYVVGPVSGATNVGGSVDVSLSGGNGGLLDTAGNQVSLASNFSLNTGDHGTWSWSQGGNISIGTGGTFGTQFVQSNLATRNFALNAVGGSITVNQAVSWSQNTTLTLSATNDININAGIAASGATAGLAMNYGGDYNILTPASYSGAAPMADPVLRPVLTLVDGPDGTKAGPVLAQAYDGNGKPVYELVWGEQIYDKNGNPVYEMSLDADGNLVRGNPVFGPVAKVDPHALANGGDGVYGSITFSNAANTNGLVINGTAYTLVHSMSGLARINSATPDINGYASGVGNYALAQNLYATSDGTASGTPTLYSNAVITSLGGTLTGLGHTVSYLEIVTTSPDAGLIGRTTIGSLVRDIGIVNVRVTTLNTSGAGALIGWNLGDVRRAYSTGSDPNFVSSVSADSWGGGLIGFSGVRDLANVNTFPTVSDSFSTVAVSGNSMVGGLIGRTVYSSVIRSHASGNVTGQYKDLGGLIGYGIGTSVYSSYATGDVKSSNTVQESNVGGLIGFLSSQSSQTIQNSFARGNVTGSTNIGGLIGSIPGLDAGYQGSPFVIDRTYAVGNVVGTLSQEEPSFWNTSGIGGLVGSGETGGGRIGTLHV
ncbi:beta strand repeat-containing protein [Nitrobacter winogradskyi]|uniref:beta strand repeat-containing protein n=1 Tax=Nitrobacter winogradskyi TaxID=913 RepID=UPI001AEDDF60|nr:YDG domain-containing protein [Nitrobacter winogradskyi]